MGMEPLRFTSSYRRLLMAGISLAVAVFQIPRAHASDRWKAAEPSDGYRRSSILEPASVCIACR